jgi:hypothetical protein
MSVHVDDFAVACADSVALSSFKQVLFSEFKMIDFGEVSVILGIRITRDWVRGTMTLSQEDYVGDVLDRFRQNSSRTKVAPLDVRMKYTKEMGASTEEELALMDKTPYRKALGCLGYLVICTRPDLANSVYTLAKFQEKPGIEHWKGIQHILQYLKKTKHFGLVYKRDPDLPLEGYCDANYAELDTRRSTSGYVFLYAGAAISWRSKLQTSTAQSTMEAEIVAIGIAAMEVTWLHKIFYELSLPLSSPIQLWSDSQGAIARILNPVFSESTKHIDVKWNIAKEKIEAGEMTVRYVAGDKNISDSLTKALGGEKTDFCRTGMGVRDIRSYRPRDKTSEEC